MRFVGIIMAAGLVLTCAPAPAHAEKRVALVIGNDRYPNLSSNEQLQKAVNDARAVGASLKLIGFEVVSGENLGRQALLARLDDAAQRLGPGDTALFFFSGHGIAVDGKNYILPSDVPTVGLAQVATLTGAAVREEDIIDRFLRAGARVTVIILDACRNNPFAGSGSRGIGVDKGLVPVDPPSGVFTLYSASRGETALDRLSDSDPNPNSVFTRALLPALVRRGLDLPGLALEVRKEVTRVARSVNHPQRPAYYDETSGDQFFLAGVAETQPATNAPVATQPQTSAASASTEITFVIPIRRPGCMIRVFQYPTTPKGETRFGELSATQVLETGRTERDEAEVAFQKGGRAWTDAALLQAKRASGRCPVPTFPLLEPIGAIP
jgi:Caspase domain